MRRFAIFLAGLIALALVPRAALAHGMRTASVDVTEIGAGHALVRLKTPAPDPLFGLRTALPCSLSPAAGGDESARLLELRCPETLDGAELTLDGLGAVHTEATVIVARADGRRQSRVLTAAETMFEIPREEGRAAIAKSYVGLGLRHIATGWDHLVFLVLLVLLLKRPRAVLAAETAFTVSHSISFSATALGWIAVPAGPAEACIALSLVLLALDIGRKQPKASYGAAMAFVFGLVHGLGFAGGLREAGLPHGHAAYALIGFAGGVELGQVAFLALCLALYCFAPKREALRRLSPVAIAALGGVSMYWLLDRLFTCLALRA